MSYQNFVERVTTWSGMSRDEVEPVIITTLPVLGSRLGEVDKRAVAARLPPELGAALCGRALIQDEPLSLDDDRVRAVCRVLASTLDEQGRAQLRMQPLTALFVH